MITSKQKKFIKFNIVKIIIRLVWVGNSMVIFSASYPTMNVFKKAIWANDRDAKEAQRRQRHFGIVNTRTMRGCCVVDKAEQNEEGIVEAVTVKNRARKTKRKRRQL